MYDFTCKLHNLLCKSIVLDEKHYFPFFSKATMWVIPNRYMRRTNEASGVATKAAAAVLHGSAAPASMLRKKPEV